MVIPMPEPCNPLECKSYALGYCEYDFATGQIMPTDEENCPLIKSQKEATQNAQP